MPPIIAESMKTGDNKSILLFLFLFLIQLVIIYYRSRACYEEPYHPLYAGKLKDPIQFPEVNAETLQLPPAPIAITLDPPMLSRYYFLISLLNHEPKEKCFRLGEFGKDEITQHECYRLCLGWPLRYHNRIEALTLNKKGAPECLVYSFGINYEFSFDDGLAKEGCQVYSFDMTMEGVQTYDRSERVHFVSFGISPLDESQADQRKPNTKTIRELKKMLGHSKRQIDVLKIDVEGDEWPSLLRAVRDGVMEQVHFLVVEWHPFNFTEIEQNIHLLQSLHSIGFRKYHGQNWDQNPAAPGFYALHGYVNINFRKEKVIY